MDPTNILAIAIVSLSAVLIVVGVYAVVILRQLHQTSIKINKIVSRVDTVTEVIDKHLVRPSTNVATALTLLREGVQIIGELRRFSPEVVSNSKAVAKEVKDVAHVVKEEVAPTIVEEVHNIISQVAEESKEVIREAVADGEDALSGLGAVRSEVVSKSESPLTSTPLQPEPMKAHSLSTKRRFFKRS